MLQPDQYLANAVERPFFAAVDDPVNAVPGLLPVIHDFERDRSRKQRRQQKKRHELPDESGLHPPKPDTEHHVDDYA